MNLIPRPPLLEKSINSQLYLKRSIKEPKRILQKVPDPSFGKVF
jgi:hypothetical protein